MAKQRQQRQQVMEEVEAIGQLRVVHMEVSAKDAMKIVPHEGQYLHLVGLADNVLPFFGSPHFKDMIRASKVTDELWYFVESNGPLGRLTIRGFFGVLPERQEVVVVGFEKVQHDDGPRKHIILKMTNRVSYYTQTQTNLHQ